MRVHEDGRAYGFTLIEMMIVVAVIGVLAAVAIPAYRSYVIRAQVSEGLTLAAPMRIAAAQYYALNGVFPQERNWTNALAALGLPNSSIDGAGSGRYVKRIFWHTTAGEEGIYIRYRGGALEDRLLFLEARPGPGALAWRCRTPDTNGVDPAYLPAACRP